MTRIAMVVVALAVTACTARVSERGVSGVPGEEAWKTQVELDIGEVAHVDGQDLEIRLDAVGVNDAVVSLRTGGVSRRETLRTGAGGGVVLRPYEIRLVSTGIDATALIEVRRQWGQ